MNEQNRWHIGVVIPARNEEELIVRCLTSVLTATKAVSALASVDIVVVADRSTDRTEQLAESILKGQGIVARSNAGSVGSARRTAALIALERYAGPLGMCWLANTDADCVVPRSWLGQQLKIAESGFEAIGGTVSVDSFQEHQPWVEERFAASYLIQADGSHAHVHGANLGVRADSYLRAGGWAELETAEDHDLWRRLSMTGARRHATSQVEVVTSGRRIGRAPSGFAGALAAHN